MVSSFLNAHRVRMRKLSLASAMVGLGCFVTGAIVPALLIRILTECLRMPTFIHEQKRDQVQLCCVVLLMCAIGLIRYAFF